MTKAMTGGIGLAESVEEMILKAPYITKAQQKLIILIRMNKNILEGRHSQRMYKSLRFYVSMRQLVAAGWVKKTLRYNCDGRPAVCYSLTEKGLCFNKEMMQFPPYKPIWDKRPRYE